MNIPEYEAAVIEHDAALRDYYLIRNAYCACAVDDETFLAARRRLMAAAKRFDEVYAAVKGKFNGSACRGVASRPGSYAHAA